MRIEYEPNLVEQTVFLATRQDTRLEAELHKAGDRLYELTDSVERESHFQEVHAVLFRCLGIDEVLSRLLGERPLIEQRIDRCIARQAVSARKEAAELFVKHGEDSPEHLARSLFIFVCPQSLLRLDEFKQRMRRELLHVADMLDDQFGYIKDSLTGHHPRQNLIRDRFRVLWDVFVEGRLHREGHSEEKLKLHLRSEFARAFGRPSNGHLSNVFDQVFQAADLTHERMLEWARSPSILFEDNCDSRRSEAPVPGSPCPLCAFTTFDWAAPSDISSARSRDA